MESCMCLCRQKSSELLDRKRKAREDLYRLELYPLLPWLDHGLSKLRRMHKMGSMTVTICIMLMIFGEMLIVMSIKSVMEMQGTILSRKVVRMRDDRMQEQQQIRRKQAQYGQSLSVHTA